MKYLLIISLLFIGCSTTKNTPVIVGGDGITITKEGDKYIVSITKYPVNKWPIGTFLLGDSTIPITNTMIGYYAGTKKAEIKKDTTHLSPYILSVKYINCSFCENHDIEEQFPDDAAKIFYEKGWRNIKDRILCPDHYRDYQRNKLKL